MYFVYILKSFKTNRYYIGQTSNLKLRLREHNLGLVKSTQFGRPWKLRYWESYLTRAEAMKRERQLKSYKHGRAFKKLLEKSAERPNVPPTAG